MLQTPHYAVRKDLFADSLWEGLLSPDVLNLGAQDGMRSPWTGSRKAGGNKSGSIVRPIPDNVRRLEE